MSSQQAATTYQEGQKIKYDYVRQKLKLKSLEAKNYFRAKYPQAHQYLIDRGLDLAKIRDYTTKLISAGALTSALLLSPPVNVKSLPAPQEVMEKLKSVGEKSVTPDVPQKVLLDSLSAILPQKTRALSREEEKVLEQVFNAVLGVKAKANLEGEHLNTTYGLIGAEQHLRRYPGDVVASHGPYLKEGIAPGLGAWGYFAPSREALTPDLVETEKWYAVVQTLYLPDWNTRFKYLRDWYKYRKVLIVNTDNGNAVVAAIADSGPAAWTGKHFGGSPEVMEYLGGPRYKKGPVVVFFVDDPDNKMPLGPVNYNKLAAGISLTKI
jgi:hypothetical protein